MRAAFAALFLCTLAAMASANPLFDMAESSGDTDDQYSFSGAHPGFGKDASPNQAASLNDDGGDSDSDTIGAVYHMSMADFQKQTKDMSTSADRTAREKKQAAAFHAQVRKAEGHTAPKKAPKKTSTPKQKQSPSAMEVAAGKAEELKKLRQEAQSVRKMQKRREEKATEAAKKSITAAYSVSHKQSVYHNHGEGAEGAGKGMKEVYHPQWEKTTKAEAGKMKAGHGLLSTGTEKKTVEAADPWDPNPHGDDPFKINPTAASPWNNDAAPAHGAAGGPVDLVGRLPSTSFIEQSETGFEGRLRALETKAVAGIQAVQRAHALKMPHQGKWEKSFNKRLGALESKAQRETMQTKLEGRSEDLVDVKATKAKALRNELADAANEVKAAKAKFLQMKQGVAKQAAAVDSAEDKVARLQEDIKIEDMH